jgi:hypothetical protein
MGSSWRYLDAETIVLACHLSRRCLRTASPKLCKTLHEEITSNTLLDRRRATGHITEFGDALDPRLGGSTPVLSPGL